MARSKIHCQNLLSRIRRFVCLQELLDDSAAVSGGWIMRIALFVVCIALGGLVGCAATVKAEPPPATDSLETAKYDVNVGKDYWAKFSMMLLGKPTFSGGDYRYVAGGTHFKIDGVVEGYIAAAGQNIPDKGHYYYRV